MATPAKFRRSSLLCTLLSIFMSLVAASASSSHEFAADGRVIELDESNFDSVISAFDYVLVDFYAPWCGHCKRLNPELDAAAPQLASLPKPVVIAKIDADKYRNLASKYEIDGYPTLKVFIHGVPIEYTGSRKSEMLVRFLKKFVAPDVSVFNSDSSVRDFVEAAGKDFPIFIGFGLNESMIVDLAAKFKRKAWFSVATDFSEEMMVVYDFDKVPAVVALHPQYNEQSIFYGPYEGKFLEDFIRQNLLPLVVPISHETLKMLNDDERKIVLTIMNDVLDEKSSNLVKVLRSAATANRDLVFGYVGFKQWAEFVENFDVGRNSELPKMLVWDGDEEYHLVVGSEILNEDDELGSQISHFLEGYKEGRTIKKRLTGPTFLGFINSLISMRSVYIIVFIVGLFMLIINLTKQGADVPPSRRQMEIEGEDTRASSSGQKED